jgi:hypothetical protein
MRPQFTRTEWRHEDLRCTAEPHRPTDVSPRFAPRLRSRFAPELLGNAEKCLEALTTFRLLGKNLHLPELHLHTYLEDTKNSLRVDIDIRADPLDFHKISALIEINVVN